MAHTSFRWGQCGQCLVQILKEHIRYDTLGAKALDEHLMSKKHSENRSLHISSLDTVPSITAFLKKKSKDTDSGATSSTSTNNDNDRPTSESQQETISVPTTANYYLLLLVNLSQSPG